mgnify:CR=1 FL=1
MKHKYIQNSKEGFTLIELIVVISLITTIFGCGFTGIRTYNNTRNNMDVQLFGNSLIEFIVNSKEYCRDGNISGCLFFNTGSSRVVFSSNTNLIGSLSLPEGFGGLSINLPDGRVVIDNKGFTPNACTISFRDRKGGIHYATICVGSSYAEFKY